MSYCESCAGLLRDLKAAEALLASLQQERDELKGDAERARDRSNAEIGRRERAEIYASRCESATARMALKLNEADADRSSLIAALREYGQHKPECDISTGKGTSCKHHPETVCRSASACFHYGCQRYDRHSREAAATFDQKRPSCSCGFSDRLKEATK